MSASEMALVRGMAETRAVLARWNQRPLEVVGAWTLASVAITTVLLLAVWVVASASTPDATPHLLPGLNTEAGWDDVAHVLQRNSLVLALHAFACVAGFIAGSSLPHVARNHRGLMRTIHEKAGPLAIGFVVCATAFSLATQAYVLGGGTATVAAQVGVSRGVLLLSLLPHALPELVALFLPLAAWMIASRRGEWNELLAATVVTVALAVPVLIAAAVVEVFVFPEVITALGGAVGQGHYTLYS